MTVISKNHSQLVDDEGTDEHSDAFFFLPPDSCNVPTNRGERVSEKWREIDPVEVFHQLKFASHCKDFREFEEALLDGLQVFISDSDDCRDIADATEVHSRSSLQRSLQKLDAVAMALTQRELEELSRHPERVESAHLFSDGSDVCGTEMQGMVLQIVLKGEEVSQAP